MCVCVFIDHEKEEETETQVNSLEQSKDTGLRKSFPRQTSLLDSSSCVFGNLKLDSLSRRIPVCLSVFFLLMLFQLNSTPVLERRQMKNEEQEFRKTRVDE